MKTAVVGSRGLYIENFDDYMPEGTTEIITGGAKGIDQCAERYAKEKNIPLTVVRPDYRRYGKGAPLKRNSQIIAMVDIVLAFWDGKSSGTRYVIEQCGIMGKTVKVFYF